jgi:hypothetical protein
MSDGTDKISCISHKANTHFFVMYEDFLNVASVSEHWHKLAAFWRVLETKTNDRIIYNQKLTEDATKKGLAEPETDLWIEIPYSEFVNRSLGTYKSSSFQVASAESERLGFSKTRLKKRPCNPQDPMSPLEDYKEYLFLTEVIQSVINGGEYPPPIEINSPLLKSISARKEKKKAAKAIEINSSPVLNSTAPPIEINRINNITGESSNNNEDISVNASALTPTQSSENDSHQPPATVETQASVHIATTKGDTTHDRSDNKHMVGAGSDHGLSGNVSSVRNSDVLDDENHDGHPSEHPHRVETPQVAHVGVATRNTDSLVEDVTQATAQKPARNTSKRGSKRKQDLEAITAEPPPEKPSLDIPWNVLTCMALADYYRGYTLTNGSYGKALEEAKKLIQRGKTYRQVDATFRYMTGTEKKEDGTGLFDEYWQDKTVDIWHVNTHIDAKLKEIKEKRNPTQISQARDGLAQSISNTRNLDKEMAEMEARYSRKKA